MSAESAFAYLESDNPTAFDPQRSTDQPTAFDPELTLAQETMLVGDDVRFRPSNLAPRDVAQLLATAFDAETLETSCDQLEALADDLQLEGSNFAAYRVLEIVREMRDFG